MDIWCERCEFVERNTSCFTEWYCSRHKKTCDDALLSCDLALILQKNKRKTKKMDKKRSIEYGNYIRFKDSKLLFKNICWYLKHVFKGSFYR